jgi:hypothetical protein
MKMDQTEDPNLAKFADALNIYRDLLAEISASLVAACQLPEGKMSPAQATDFRARHWQTLWDASLKAIEACDSSPAKILAVFQRP